MSPHKFTLKIYCSEISIASWGRTQPGAASPCPESWGSYFRNILIRASLTMVYLKVLNIPKRRIKWLKAVWIRAIHERLLLNIPKKRVRWLEALWIRATQKQLRSVRPAWWRRVSWTRPYSSTSSPSKKILIKPIGNLRKQSSGSFRNAHTMVYLHETAGDIGTFHGYWTLGFIILTLGRIKGWFECNRMGRYNGLQCTFSYPTTSHRGKVGEVGYWAKRDWR